MAISSTMLPLGTVAPRFTLPDTISDRPLSYDELRGERGTVVMFLCNHCPYVVHVNDQLVRLAGEYFSRGIGFVAISANDPVQYPEDAPDRMKEQGERLHYPFPYLFDESQDVARAYQAACTPDFYLFDTADRLVYRGQLDDTRPSSGRPATGRDLRAALDALLAGDPIDGVQIASIGCGIKWRRE